MKISVLCGALILGGLMAATAPPMVSLAQPNPSGASAPKDTGAAAPKDSGASAAKSAPKGATPNTNMNPTKHRYWRHRGGRHPHYGSRRIRT